MHDAVRFLPLFGLMMLGTACKSTGAAPTGVGATNAPQPAGDALVIVGGARHPAAASLEDQAGVPVPVVIHGHGLPLVLTPQVVAVNLNGLLLVGRVHEESHSIVMRAVVKPGAKPASGAPTASDDGRTWSTGPDGATIHLEPQVGTLGDVLKIEQLFEREGVSIDGEWRVMGANGASVPLLHGLSVRSVDGPGHATSFLHMGTTFIDTLEINGPYGQLPTAKDVTFPGATYDGEGVTGDVVFHELSYQAENAAWRQRFYVFPIDGELFMTLKVQTRAESADKAFAMADQLAAGFVPPPVGG